MTLLGSSSSLKKRSSVALAPDADEDAQLLENPLDLVCPITHELFRDPVINSAGQVYERYAVERALAHRLVDPISNTPLETAALTTVWPIRSKASAYREKAIRGCIARVCQPGCKAPIRFLRRAAELCGAGAGGGSRSPSSDPSTLTIPGGTPGLTPDVIDYLLTHPSSIYDFQGLVRFAEALMLQQHSDMAATLYTTLLLGGDTGQQVEALQGLLRCWGDGCAHHSAGGGGAGGGGGGGLRGRGSCALDGYDMYDSEMDEQRVVERLAGLSCGEGNEGLRPARMVDLLLAAGLEEGLVVRFCEYILGGAGGGSGGQGCGLTGSGGLGSGAGANGGMAGGAAGACGLAAPGTSCHAELLYRYTRLRCGRLEGMVARRSTVSYGGVGSGEKAAGSGGSGPAGDAEEGQGSQDGGGGGRAGRGRRLREVQRAVCSGVCALVTLTGVRHPLARLLSAVSLVLLAHPVGGGGGKEGAL